MPSVCPSLPVFPFQLFPHTPRQPGSIEKRRFTTSPRESGHLSSAASFHGYNKYRKAFVAAAAPLLDEAEVAGIDREEAIHNLLFLIGFNAYGGWKVVFPMVLKYIGEAGEELQGRLASEIRRVIKEDGGAITLSGIEKMSLTRSVVRMEPPVPFQYAKAREDIQISSHDAACVIKKGETICGIL